MTEPRQRWMFVASSVLALAGALLLAMAHTELESARAEREAADAIREQVQREMKKTAALQEDLAKKLKS